MSSPHFAFFRSLVAVSVSIVAASLSPVAHAARPPRGWPEKPFEPLTAARIAALPADQRAQWQAYWDASEAEARTLPARQTPDISSLKPVSTPPKGGIHTKGLSLDQPSAWYASEKARTIAGRVVAAQISNGAWTKGMNYTVPAATVRLDAHGWSSGTFDNDATIFELRFLAKAISAGGGEPRSAAWRASFDRGMRYVFAAQYPNGGFPQIYPLIGGYHDGITFNDDAMTHVLELLRDVAMGKTDYAFAPPPLREECGTRLERGIRCVLATQLRTPEGRRTVWCQQYDPLTLRAVAARNFEPIADCSRESAAITLFLMSLPDPSADVVAAVKGAVDWFHKTELHDLKIARAPDDTRGDAVPSAGAPPLWARFYDPGTATPIFGDRDRTIHYDLHEVSSERVAGYTWYTRAPAEALEQFVAWRTRVAAH